MFGIGMINKTKCFLRTYSYRSCCISESCLFWKQRI